MAGINFIVDLINLKDNEVEMKKIATALKGIGITSLKKMVEKCADVIDSIPPPTIYHLVFPNPCEGKYGNKWKEKIKKSKTLSGHRCITDLVTHIIKTSAMLFEDTEYKDTWKLYHDALSLMTTKRTINWMKSMGYYKYWIKPEMGICDEFPRHKDNMIGSTRKNAP